MTTPVPSTVPGLPARGAEWLDAYMRDADAEIRKVADLNSRISEANTNATEAETTAVAASRGDISYVWNGTAFVLAPGEVDNGVSARLYKGGAAGSVEAQAGWVARSGDWHLVVPS